MYEWAQRAEDHRGCRFRALLFDANRVAAAAPRPR